MSNSIDFLLVISKIQSPIYCRSPQILMANLLRWMSVTRRRYKDSRSRVSLVSSERALKLSRGTILSDCQDAGLAVSAIRILIGVDPGEYERHPIS